DWCITCKVNEKVALGTDEVKSAFAAESITYLKGDWTNSDPVITEYLAAFARNGVPLYVYYPASSSADTTPTVLPQILTPSIVIEAIR
ncbi:MAG: thioredoxin family protein, partial [Pseudomonadales bacterium]|nr:thioredoxin family protein [Pseudomonadales bacterium]